MIYRIRKKKKKYTLEDYYELKKSTSESQTMNRAPLPAEFAPKKPFERGRSQGIYRMNIAEKKANLGVASIQSEGGKRGGPNAKIDILLFVVLHPRNRTL